MEGGGGIAPKVPASGRACQQALRIPPFPCLRGGGGSAGCHGFLDRRHLPRGARGRQRAGAQPLHLQQEAADPAAGQPVDGPVRPHAPHGPRGQQLPPGTRPGARPAGQGCPGRHGDSVSGSLGSSQKLSDLVSRDARLSHLLREHGPEPREHWPERRRHHHR